MQIGNAFLFLTEFWTSKLIKRITLYKTRNFLFYDMYGIRHIIVKRYERQKRNKDWSERDKVNVLNIEEKKKYLNQIL